MKKTDPKKVESKFGRFFLPGPTEVKPDVLAAMTRPMIAHRGAEFEALYGRLQAGLGGIFRTSRPVYVSASSATGMMEAAVRNAPAGRVLSVVNGAFAKRFSHVAKSCGRDVEVFDVEWGRGADIAGIEKRLSAGKFAAVTVVHSETSTGALSDVKAAAEVCARHGVTVLVDSVSGCGGAPLLPDDWGIDFVFTGSQKAIAIPPGLAFSVASERYVAAAAAIPNRGTYFDIVEFDKFSAKRQTPSTPAVSLLFALDAQLERMVSEGIEARWARHAAMSDRTVAWTAEMSAEMPGVGMLPPAGERSPTVSCIRMPDGLSGTVVAASMVEAGFTIAPGYGPLAETTVRIGHMGEHTVEELEDVLGKLAEIMKRLRG